MRQEHFDELGRRDRQYWWFRTRYALVLRLLRQVHGPRASEGLLDFGCGAGGFLRHALDDGFVTADKAVGVDGDASAVRTACSTGLTAMLATADSIGQAVLPVRPDVLTSLDVLEHLDDPIGLLRRLLLLAQRPATIVVLVPAMPSLWSAWDERLAHRRRYDRRTLTRHLNEAGWATRHVRFVFPSMVAPAVFRRHFGVHETSDEFPRVSPAVNRLLTTVTGLESRMPWWPFGTSLAAVATAR